MLRLQKVLGERKRTALTAPILPGKARVEGPINRTTRYLLLRD